MKQTARPTEADLLGQILERLNVLINIALDSRPDTPGMVSSKISALSSMGLSPSEISRIVGKESNYVTATLSQAKKRKPLWATIRLSGNS